MRENKWQKNNKVVSLWSELGSQDVCLMSITEVDQSAFTTYEPFILIISAYVPCVIHRYCCLQGSEVHPGLVKNPVGLGLILGAGGVDEGERQMFVSKLSPEVRKTSNHDDMALQHQGF